MAVLIYRAINRQESPAAVPSTSTAGSNSAYTVAPDGSVTNSADHWSREDFSQQANPDVFTGVYSRDLYNTIRQTLVDGNSTFPAYTMVAKGDDYSAAMWLLGRIDGLFQYEHFVPRNLRNYYEYLDYFAVSTQMPNNYQMAFDFIQPTIAIVNQLETDREKVEYLNDYLCGLLAYSREATAGIERTFSQHSVELDAACGSYAHNFKFLCAAANIPCFTVSSTTHAWNLTYVDGEWLHVDVSANDLSGYNRILFAKTYQEGKDQAPQATAFLKELLVPNSTK